MDKKTLRRFVMLSVLALPIIHKGLAFADSATPHLYTIKQGTVTRTLYYTGTIEPIRNVPVTSPTQGVIDKINFIYGQVVKKNEVLMHVESQKILNNLRDARVAYLKSLDDYNQKLNWQQSSTVLNAQDAVVRAKRSLTQDQNSFQENEKLFKLGIISRDTLSQSKNTYQDAISSYKQSKRSLDAAIGRGTGDNLTISQLSLANSKAKYDSLKAQVDSHEIKSPADGIVLLPATGQNSNSNSSDTSGSSSSSGGTSSGKLGVGSSVQYQEVLVNIGDMSGLQIKFNIPETNINEIKSGDTAIVTGAGFPGIKLNGEVTNIGAQAADSGGGSLPTFPAMVIVKKLTAAQSKWIRSGMDSQIAINVYSAKNQITVPVSAVKKDKNGASYVMLYNDSSDTPTKQLVTTGKVQTHSVQILSGLKAGQTVELPNKS